MSIWIVVALTIAAAIVILLATWRRRDQPGDLGVVSHQWIAEHRLSSEPDSRR